MLDVDRNLLRTQYWVHYNWYNRTSYSYELLFNNEFYVNNIITIKYINLLNYLIKYASMFNFHLLK